ncbi:hypothetical protein PHYC_03463 [Phycisphaerales bacterium]|nr:hypothetical protein PHYC_03463 [Phycisphaerales bacterium]
MSYTTFNPSPDAAAKVLDDLTNPANSLRDTAALHNTSLNALSLWITSPEVQARLLQQGSAAASITRLLAANHTHDALAAIVTATRESTALLNAAPRPDPAAVAAAYQAQSASEPALPTDAGPEASSPKVGVGSPIPHSSLPPLSLLEFRRRLVESLRKNSNLIFRLTRFEFFDPSTRPAPRAARPRADAIRQLEEELAELRQLRAQATNSRAPGHSVQPSPTPAAQATRAKSPTPATPVTAASAPSTTDATPIPTAAISPSAPVVVPSPTQPVSFDLNSPVLPVHNSLHSGKHRPGIPRPRAPASLIAAAGC